LELLIKIRSPQKTLRILLLTLSLLVAGCLGAKDASWNRIQEEGTLRVGLDPTYPPFEIAEGDEVRGFDVELARALAEELSLEAQFTYFGYDGLYDALATEQVDVLISALVIRPDQMDDFAYSEPYFNAGQILLVPDGGSGIETMEDLSERSLAVELGSQGHYEATQWQRRIRDLTIDSFNTSEEAMNAVADGQVDAALVDGISGRLYAGAHETVRQAGPPVTVEPFALVVRIEDERLLKELNQSLQELEDSGALQALESRWLH
jgi:polar amino acid transport system substrate-binding protein